MNIALVYDRVNKIGGAERVLQALHDIWPDAPLFTSVYSPDNAPWAKDFKVIPSFLNQSSFIRTHHEYFPNLMPYAFESFNLSQYDVIISVTSAEAKGVITLPHQLHICYLLTPTRYLWSHYEEYSKGTTGFIKKPLLNSLKKWDKVASSRPDKYIAISKSVANRCEQYYQRTPDAIIYPPVDTKQFSSHTENLTDMQPGYFLVVSRLVPYKRVDLAIKACNQLNERLVIVGTGSELNHLKKIAGPTITFVGQVDDKRLACLYHHAKGFLFPQEEEFGITALEAQAAGIPVVAFNKGSAVEIVKENVTGVLFNNQSVVDLVHGINLLLNHTWYDKTIREHSMSFDKTVFVDHIKQFVEETWKQQQTLA